MRIITMKRLEEFWLNAKYRDSKSPLLDWKDHAEQAAWQDPIDVKETFGKRVDFVKSRKTGRPLAVFDIAGNKYRLVAAIHYLEKHSRKGRIYVLRIMTHREYDENVWRDDF